MFTYYGSCPNARESLILFEAVRMGLIPMVPDRLSDGERKKITSGSIYVWDEVNSPMRRWTDGRTWSNSRVVGDFLEYRETDADTSSSSRPSRSILKPYGLKKRTICLPAQDHSSLRLIAYSNSADERNGTLPLPSSDPQFAEIVKNLESNPLKHDNLQTLVSMGRRRKSKLDSAKSVDQGSGVGSSLATCKSQGDSENWGNSAIVKDPSILHPIFQSYVGTLPVRAPHEFVEEHGENFEKSRILPLPIWRSKPLSDTDHHLLDLLNSHFR